MVYFLEFVLWHYMQKVKLYDETVFVNIVSTNKVLFVDDLCFELGFVHK